MEHAHEFQIVAGHVLTMDPARPSAEAIAIAGERIVAVGDRAEAVAALPPGTPVHEPGGAAIVPGLIDSHLHMQWAGLKLLHLLGEPDGGEAPALEQALEALDSEQPHWTGPDPTPGQRLQALRLIQPVLHALGIVAVVDPAVVPADLAAYVEANRRGELTVRVVAMPHPDLEAGAAAAIAALDGIGARTGLGDEQLRLGGVKVYFDGVGKDGSALRREPWPGHEDEPGGRGQQRVGDEEFEQVARWCARERWSLGVHVVGGGGIDRVLAAFARADAEAPIGELGFTLIHAYLEPSAENMELAARLGVMVAAQPSIHWWNGTGLQARLGPSARAANPLRAWIEAGVAVGGGSDGPYFPLDPRLGLWQARTREVRGGDGPHDPGLALDAEQALALYTTGSAAVSLAGGRRGALRPGLAADWAVLSVDPVTAAPAELRTLSVLETAVGGARVHTNQSGARA